MMNKNNNIKHLSSIANHVLKRCAQTLDSTVDELVQEFETTWKPEACGYSRKLVEYCSSRALYSICYNMEEKINDGSFSRFTYDMMLAWERPSSTDDELPSEARAKESEDKNLHMRVGGEMHEDIPLFYSDLMPLLVNEEPSIGEEAYVWMGSLVPLAVDVVNGHFTFVTLTEATAHRLYFPAYDKFLKEIDKCIKHLQKQAKPTAIEFVEDEFILHVEGTATSQRVVRHIGGISRPGRLTLTNYALYFETCGVISYENALKIDLSSNVDHSVKRSATGPWGAPLFDKGITYESSQLSDSVVLEFPEMKGSTRRDHWFALIQEIILLHKFLSKFNITSPLQVWDIQARTMLAIVRLHAAREMLRISPPIPSSFLIFTLFDELPKGDFVLEELANGLKQFASVHPCSGTSILKSLNVSSPTVSSIEVKEEIEEIKNDQADSLSALENTINQVKEEAKETIIAKAGAERLKEDGIGDSITVLMELLSPMKKAMPWFEEILSWKRPATSIIVFVVTLVIIYKEWIGVAIAAILFWLVLLMIFARYEKLRDQHKEIVVSTGSNQQTTMESIVSAQHGLNTVRDIIQRANITILKIHSIFLSRAPKHANQVMAAMVGLAILLAVIPFKYVILILAAQIFVMNTDLGKSLQSEQSKRRLKEWWNSIPVVPVRTEDKSAAQQ
ncbi:hypothetical protein Scep_003562 [Stephania cephalantha]|uniref:Uncharacterized protein n=1 Tax=Stephania cephalantha TaxID=152367 RepID=A0AAP0KQR2_9MAGN